MHTTAPAIALFALLTTGAAFAHEDTMTAPSTPPSTISSKLKTTPPTATRTPPASIRTHAWTTTPRPTAMSMTKRWMTEATGKTA